MRADLIELAAGLALFGVVIWLVLDGAGVI